MELSPFDISGSSLRAQTRQRSGDACVPGLEEMARFRTVEEADRKARRGRSLGAASGERIGLLTENRIEWPGA